MTPSNFSFAQARRILASILLTVSAGSIYAQTADADREAQTAQLAADMEKISANAAQVYKVRVPTFAEAETYAKAHPELKHVSARVESTVQVTARAGKSQPVEELTAEHLELIDRAWAVDQVHAMVSLRQLIAKMERSGLTDKESTASNAYWMMANAMYANKLSCDMVYGTLYKSVVLGFQSQWPVRAEAYQNLLGELNECVPVERREQLKADARETLDKTPFRNRIQPQLAEEGGMTANVPAKQVKIGDIHNKLATSINSMFSVLLTVGAIMAGVVIIITAGGAMFGSSGGSASSSTTPAPATSKRSSTKEKRAAVSTDKRPSATVNKTKRRTGLQRLNPWN